MSAVRKITSYWFVDGVSCVGKTSWVRNRNPYFLLMDFDVRSKTNPFFRQKATDHVVQVLYTSSFALKLMSTLRQLDNAAAARTCRAAEDLPERCVSADMDGRGFGTTNNPINSGSELDGSANADDGASTLLCDRSPVSDIWYELLFKHYDDDARYAQVFDWIEEIDLFAMVPTIFVIPHADHAPRIAEQMAVRNNGIDHICEDYIIQQIRVFEAVAARFATHRNVRVIRIAADQKIYSPEYFVWLGEQFTACIASSTKLV